MFVLDRVAKGFVMKALLCTRLGPPESLVLTEGLPSPKVRDTHARRRASLLERLGNLLGVRATTDESLDVGIARAVEEAFASIAREYRR